MIEFKCDICKKHKPFAEIYPYRIIEKTKDGFELDVEFTGTWSYCCIWCFIILKISEKLKLTRYRYAWVKTNKDEYELMMKEIGEMRK